MDRACHASADPWGPVKHAQTTAYRIRTARLLLRCWSPQDAPGCCAAIEESLDHLRAWMDWARHEPESLHRKAERLRRFRAEFEAGRNFVFGIFDAEETRVVGGIGLHPRVGAGGCEIGYWVHVDHTRRGLATEAAAAVTRVGFEIEKLARIEIHCDPRNVASAAIARKLGYTHQVTVPRWLNAPRLSPRDTMFWVLRREDYPSSPAASAAVEVRGGFGERLL